jgi:vitamin K-dependent gamma-carboxylase
MSKVEASKRHLNWQQRGIMAFIVVWFSWQILFPLRHVLYPGDPSWTEEGHTFAWMMKLRDKKASIKFFVRDPATGKQWTVRPKEYLLSHQARKVGTRPDLILQFAHHLQAVWKNEYELQNVEVRVRSCVSLNGRPAALLIDPQRDLTKVKLGWQQADWILPLNVPFQRPPQRRGRYDLSC